MLVETYSEPWWMATPQAAIHAGYERAFGTILDSNVTTLIAGLALLIFGSLLGLAVLVRLPRRARA